MSLFDWSRDERKAAIRRLAQNCTTPIPLGWLTAFVPDGTKLELTSDEGDIYRFPTETAKFNPLEAETMCVLRTRKRDVDMQYGMSISLKDYVVMMTMETTRDMPVPVTSPIKTSSVNGFPLMRIDITSELGIAATTIAIDFNDSYYTFLAFMYEKCKAEDYDILIKRILSSIV